MEAARHMAKVAAKPRAIQRAPRPLPARETGSESTVKRRPIGPVAVALLRQAWAIRLRLSGFDDLENADDPDGPLSTRGTASHLRDRARRDVAWDCDDGHTVSRVDVEHLETTAAYYRSVTHLAHRFKDQKDRAIALSIGDGRSQDQIKAEHECGQDRIERIVMTVRGWMGLPVTMVGWKRRAIERRKRNDGQE